jgi:hypothetical protein
MNIRRNARAEVVGHDASKDIKTSDKTNSPFSESFKRLFAELKEATWVAHAISPNITEFAAEESAVQLVHSWRQRRVIIEYSGKVNKRRQNNRKEARKRQRLYRQRQEQLLLGL